MFCKRRRHETNPRKLCRKACRRAERRFVITKTIWNWDAR